MAEKEEDGMTVKEMWLDAEAEFNRLTGRDLRNGPKKSFEEVQAEIESRSKPARADAAVVDGNWDKEKLKDAGLKVLKCLKMLIGAATQLSSILPIPSGPVANMCANALTMVLDIPQAIRDLNGAISEVFTTVSSVLSQFRIYERLDRVDNLLARQIHLVMISFVKVCAHVVNYQQGGRWERLVKKTKKAVLNDDSGLSAELNKFEKLVQQQRDVEGTVVLEEVITSRKTIYELLERATETGQRIEDIHGKVNRLDEDATERREENDKMKNLIKIRDTLNVLGTVRLDTNTTQTCTNYYAKCLDGTGAWIWEHPLYQEWTSPTGKASSPVLILSGGSASGKTAVTAMITKKLEEQKRTRIYVAHYFFPPSRKKSDDDKYPVQSALKYMAFQIARVDATVASALGKACETLGGVSFRSLVDLKTLWNELKVGSPRLGATYYIIFDGLEHLPEKHSDTLLDFVLSFKASSDPASANVRLLVSGTEKVFRDHPSVENALRIDVSEHSISDMELVINHELNTRGMLQVVKPGSKQEQARQIIREQLPRSVNGSYSLLQFSLDNIIRRLDSGAGLKELQDILKTSMSSHEAAIQSLQRSLASDEIRDLNELLKWVVFGAENINLDQLEAAMYLYSGNESLATLEYIIKNKYSAVLEIEENYVLIQDHVEEILRKEKRATRNHSSSQQGPKISMSITISNVDQEVCQHFLWDLAQKSIRDKFRFDFDTASNILQGSQSTIEVDEFEAHHTIVKHTFEYLDNEPSEQTKAIGQYLVVWLPFHLTRLRELETEDKGELMPLDKRNIANGLYNLFKSSAVFQQHKDSFERQGRSYSCWTPSEMMNVNEWFMDSAATSRLDKKWLNGIRSASNPTRGYLRPLVELVLDQFLRNRTWGALSGYRWIEQFFIMDTKPNGKRGDANISRDEDETLDISWWKRISQWCQDYLGLSDDKLDSLWYERLAEAGVAARAYDDADTAVMELYQTSLGLPDPSWLSYKGFGKEVFRLQLVEEAIVSTVMALECAKAPNSSPTPKPEDIIELNLQLGEYYYEASILDKAADHYSSACMSDDICLARKAEVGHLKVRMCSPNAEAARQLLRETLSHGGSEARFVLILQELARDDSHDALISRIFTVAKSDESLIRDIVHALETASAAPDVYEQLRANMSTDERFAVDEARGVLLYDRGLAAYLYKAATVGSEPNVEALKLWKECCKQLAHVGGHRAYRTRDAATTALAKYYFQSITEGKHLDSLRDLEQLVEAGSHIVMFKPVGFLGALYSQLGDKERSLKSLSRDMKLGLQILSDYNEDNDFYGFTIILNALLRIGDLQNAAMALSLGGVPDLVTEGLTFYAEPSRKLGREIFQAAKAQVPDSREQLERIQVAKEHVKALLENPDMATVEETTTKAYIEIQAKLDALEDENASGIRAFELTGGWMCDGTEENGRYCRQIWDADNDFYYCLFCANTVFCERCLSRLRNPSAEDGADVFACSHKHKWLKVPRVGADMYVGPKGKSIPIPTSIVPAKQDDDRILEIRYENDKEIPLDTWKEKLAETWGFSLAEIAKEMQRVASPMGQNADNKDGLAEDDSTSKKGTLDG